ncbi:hypothetical protein KOR42_07900 [Thalassoglobus neptunius]|uniref:Zinc-finger domain-containing protein n=1 Tax=Thalassoglobus neptunius TaxID=1938619 RepID=A0A5C5X4B7_9PLAN|nr:hypothetical protein [Thalassoglobus neptunius]TWT57429.1 hypothetical protein KOR42_07900 [Thalassoglobus neptunius]
MNCHDAKRLMALRLGRDEADPTDWEQARRHASTCLDCRKHFKELKSAMAVLEQVDTESTYEVSKSLWPEIEGRLGNLPGRRKSSDLAGWMPVVSLTVACMLFVVVWFVPAQNPSGNSHVPGMGRGMGPIPGAFDGFQAADHSSTEYAQHKLDEDDRSL